MEVMIIDVETAEMHGDRLQLFSFEKIAWSADSEGFFIFVNIFTIAPDFYLILKSKFVWQHIFSTIPMEMGMKIFITIL